MERRGERSLHEELQEPAMTSAQQVRRVLLKDYRDLVVEDVADGSAVVREPSVAASRPNDGRGFPVSDTLYRCADLLADSGFAIVLVRDERGGVYLNAH
jgi:hypothetical protein